MPDVMTATESAVPIEMDGLAVSAGIAIGPAYLYARPVFHVERRTLSSEQTQVEAEHFEWTVTRAERDLSKILAVAREKLGDDHVDLFDAQLLMLRDEVLYQEVIHRILNENVSAEFALYTVMTEHREQMEASSSEYLRERADDLLDVQERLLTHLRRDRLHSDIVPNTIVVSEVLTAADLLLFSRRGVLGCAFDLGGATSHVSIMARALNIPAVVSTRGVTNAVQSGDLIIVDGLGGRVIACPDAATLSHYKRVQDKYAYRVRANRTLARLPAQTLDGHSVTLRANVDLMAEVSSLQDCGAEGIGLVRTEMFLIEHGVPELEEDRQYERYRFIVETLSPAPTTFRLLDLGGDKMLALAHREHNPFFGWRGVRVLLDRPDILVPQLRAILRASAHGATRLLVPMVTTLEELERFKVVLEDVKGTLRRQGHAWDDGLKVGIMIEVPAAAMAADHLARQVDFFALGTNDLTAYTLAVDRTNDHVAGLYQELHPAVVRLIHETVLAGAKHKIPVTLCGELAGNARAVPLILGLGLTELSSTPAALPEVRRIIRSVYMKSTQALAAKALQAGSAQEVSNLLDQFHINTY